MENLLVIMSMQSDHCSNKHCSQHNEALKCSNLVLLPNIPCLKYISSLHHVFTLNVATQLKCAQYYQNNFNYYIFLSRFFLQGHSSTHFAFYQAVNTEGLFD